MTEALQKSGKSPANSATSEVELADVVARAATLEHLRESAHTPERKREPTPSDVSCDSHFMYTSQSSAWTIAEQSSALSLQGRHS
jgi:hypothetical protein